MMSFYKKKYADVFLFIATCCLGGQISVVTGGFFTYGFLSDLFGFFSGFSVAFLIVGSGGWLGLLLRKIFLKERSGDFLLFNKFLWSGLIFLFFSFIVLLVIFFLHR